MTYSNDTGRRFFDFMLEYLTERGYKPDAAQSSASCAIAHQGHAAAYAEYLIRQVIDIIVSAESDTAMKIMLKSMKNRITDR